MKRVRYTVKLLQPVTFVLLFWRKIMLCSQHELKERKNEERKKESLAGVAQ